MRRALLAVFVLLLAVAGGAAAVGYWGYRQFTAPGPAASDVQLVIPKGAGASAIAAHLAGAGVVADPLIFKLGARIFAEGRPLKAGEYLFPARISPQAAMELLLDGKTVVRRLTVAEGLTSREVLALVAGAEAMAGEVPAAAPPEGALLPETYHYSWGDDRAALVARMAESMQAALDELWPARAEGLPITTPEEAVILASIVEKETGVASERPRVAAVFVNRLNKGMPLQSDPTVIFALTRGEAPLGRTLTRADLTLDDPYNTYAIPGLPPGPIANPGRAALAAVLQPAQTRELYFVADGSGGHAFAETLDEHNRNVAAWRKLQKTNAAANGQGNATP
jgi:UPF0755 protein